MGHVHTVEYYSVRKKNEIVFFAGKWMDLETTLNNLTRLRKTNVACFL
jgi:hypothetical protein